MSRLVFLVLVLASGCTTTNPPIAAPEEARIPHAPPPTSGGPELSPSAPPAPAPVPSALPRHPAGIDETEQRAAPPAIGTTCASDAYCGKSGKVAVVHETLRRHREPPCAVTTTSPSAAMQITRGCVDGERIFVSSTCIPCRITTEERMLGLVADMKPSQLEAAQKLIGLPDKPLLTTTAAWTSAIAAAAKAAPKPER